WALLELARTPAARCAAAAVLPRLRPGRRGVRRGHRLAAHPDHPGVSGAVGAGPEPDLMTPEQDENAAIIQDLVAILPEVKEQVDDLDLVYEVAGAFALRLRFTTVRPTPPAGRSRGSRLPAPARQGSAASRAWGAPASSSGRVEPEWGTA